MRLLPLYQVDAFTDRVLGGNPAAVMPLETWLPDTVLQQLAAEHNLSETAFFVPVQHAAYDYHLRWFSPLNEVDLCGHATQAAAFVIFEKLSFPGAMVRFQSRSGLLTVARRDGRYALDFPSWELTPVAQHTGLQRVLGVPIREIYQGTDWVVVLEDAGQVRALEPNFTLMRDLEGRGVIVTAPGEGGIDFVSRAFYPKLGIDEDPVTGSAHCALTPYWAKRLGKPRLQARQLSRREGHLLCEMLDGRVHISGHAVLFMEATCHLP